MMLSLNNNLMAGNAARNLGNNYSRLAASVERLSSGLRVNRAADDAAGLSIRELMRAEIASLHQGVRNANDAVSLIQTADGALAIIDEKLIRMKELTMQAATGTYNSDQRLMIASEFQAMGMEIDRIALSTEYNGIKLLDGSLGGEHNGSGLQSTGALKVHFGSGNEAAEDYYYMNIHNATLRGLGLSTGSGYKQRDSAEGLLPGDHYGGYRYEPNKLSTVKMFWARFENGGPMQWMSSGVIVGVIPKGTKNLRVHINDNAWDDSIQLFDLKGNHILGSQFGTPSWTDVGGGIHPANLYPGPDHHLSIRISC